MGAVASSCFGNGVETTGRGSRHPAGDLGTQGASSTTAGLHASDRSAPRNGPDRGRPPAGQPVVPRQGSASDILGATPRMLSLTTTNGNPMLPTAVSSVGGLPDNPVDRLCQETSDGLAVLDGATLSSELKHFPQPVAVLYVSYVTPTPYASAFETGHSSIGSLEGPMGRSAVDANLAVRRNSLDGDPCLVFSTERGSTAVGCVLTNTAAVGALRLRDEQDMLNFLARSFAKDPSLKVLFQDIVKRLLQGQLHVVNHFVPGDFGRDRYFLSMRISPFAYRRTFPSADMAGSTRNILTSHTTTPGSPDAVAAAGGAYGSTYGSTTPGKVPSMGSVTPAMILELDVPYEGKELASRLQRDYMIISNIPSIVTMFDMSGHVLHQNRSSIAYMGYLVGLGLEQRSRARARAQDAMAPLAHTPTGEALASLEDARPGAQTGAQAAARAAASKGPARPLSHGFSFAATTTTTAEAAGAAGGGGAGMPGQQQQQQPLNRLQQLFSHDTEKLKEIMQAVASGMEWRGLVKMPAKVLWDSRMDGDDDGEDGAGKVDAYQTSTDSALGEARDAPAAAAGTAAAGTGTSAAAATAAAEDSAGARAVSGAGAGAGAGSAGHSTRISPSSAPPPAPQRRVAADLLRELQATVMGMSDRRARSGTEKQMQYAEASNVSAGPVREDPASQPLSRLSAPGLPRGRPGANGLAQVFSDPVPQYPGLLRAAVKAACGEAETSPDAQGSLQEAGTAAREDVRVSGAAPDALRQPGVSDAGRDQQEPHGTRGTAAEESSAFLPEPANATAAASGHSPTAVAGGSFRAPSGSPSACPSPQAPTTTATAAAAGTGTTGTTATTDTTPGPASPDAGAASTTDASSPSSSSSPQPRANSSADARAQWDTGNVGSAAVATFAQLAAPERSEGSGSSLGLTGAHVRLGSLAPSPSRRSRLADSVSRFSDLSPAAALLDGGGGSGGGAVEVLGAGLRSSTPERGAGEGPEAAAAGIAGAGASCTSPGRGDSPDAGSGSGRGLASSAAAEAGDPVLAVVGVVGGSEPMPTVAGPLAGEGGSSAGGAGAGGMGGVFGAGGVALIAPFRSAPLPSSGPAVQTLTGAAEAGAARGTCAQPSRDGEKAAAAAVAAVESGVATAVPTLSIVVSPRVAESPGVAAKVAAAAKETATAAIAAPVAAEAVAGSGLGAVARSPGGPGPTAPQAGPGSESAARQATLTAGGTTVGGGEEDARRPRSRHAIEASRGGSGSGSPARAQGRRRASEVRSGASGGSGGSGSESAPVKVAGLAAWAQAGSNLGGGGGKDLAAPLLPSLPRPPPPALPVPPPLDTITTTASRSNTASSASQALACSTNLLSMTASASTTQGRIESGEGGLPDRGWAAAAGSGAGTSGSGLRGPRGLPLTAVAEQDAAGAEPLDDLLGEGSLSPAVDRDDGSALLTTDHNFSDHNFSIEIVPTHLRGGGGSSSLLQAGRSSTGLSRGNTLGPYGGTLAPPKALAYIDEEKADEDGVEELSFLLPKVPGIHTTALMGPLTEPPPGAGAAMHPHFVSMPPAGKAGPVSSLTPAADASGSSADGFSVVPTAGGRGPLLIPSTSLSGAMQQPPGPRPYSQPLGGSTRHAPHSAGLPGPARDAQRTAPTVPAPNTSPLPVLGPRAGRASAPMIRLSSMPQPQQQPACGSSPLGRPSDSFPATHIPPGLLVAGRGHHATTAPGADSNSVSCNVLSTSRVNSNPAGTSRGVPRAGDAASSLPCSRTTTYLQHTGLEQGKRLRAVLRALASNNMGSGAGSGSTVAGGGAATAAASASSMAVASNPSVSGALLRQSQSNVGSNTALTPAGPGAGPCSSFGPRELPSCLSCPAATTTSTTAAAAAAAGAAGVGLHTGLILGQQGPMAYDLESGMASSAVGYSRVSITGAGLAVGASSRVSGVAVLSAQAPGGRERETPSARHAGRWHEVHVRPCFDPMSSEPLVMVIQTDVTSKVRAEELLARVLEAEHRLLADIFPRHVVHYMTKRRKDEAELERNGLTLLRHIQDPAAVATLHDNVTVLFADIKGFTEMSKEVPPAVVMTFLNDLYTRFDSLTDVYGVYKVETIGDCYMVAGGLVARDEDGYGRAVRGQGDTDPLHAMRVVAFARAMLEEAAKVSLPNTGEPVQVRVGCHSGSVMSGVVGQKMPRFCLFGDTINTASRMESTGRPGAIHVSSATRCLLPPEEDEEGWEGTGGVEVKGKGRMDTFLWLPHTPGARRKRSGLQQRAWLLGTLSSHRTRTTKQRLQRPAEQQDPNGHLLVSSIASQ